MEEAKVSIIVPVYKAEESIAHRSNIGTNIS